MTEFATLLKPKSGARRPIVIDRLYVFGETPTNTTFKVSINDPSQIETFLKNQTVDFTFVQKFENLIHGAGRQEKRNNDDETIGGEATVGVFITVDYTFQELETNLTNPS